MILKTIKYGRKPNFVSKKIFNKNCIAFLEIKPVLTLDKPIYVGFGILDLGVVNASFSKFSVIATHSSVYVSVGSVDLVRIFLDLFLVMLN